MTMVESFDSGDCAPARMDAQRINAITMFFIADNL
jgi:hypothetical protein